MPKRKNAFGETSPTLAGHIDSKYLKTVLDGGSLPPDAVKWFLELNGELVRPLPANWLSEVEKALPDPLNHSSRQKLIEIVHLFYFERLAIVRSVKERDLKSRLERIEVAALRLLEVIEIDGQASILVWKALECVEPGTLKRDDAYPTVTMLINRAVRAKALPKEMMQRMPTSPEPETSWINFVSGVMDIYRKSGGDVTVTKRGSSSKEPSAFSKFVFSIDRVLPIEARQHSSDIWTLSEALADARRKIGEGFLINIEKGKTPE